MLVQNVYSQFSEDEQRQIDSLNVVLNDEGSHDTVVVNTLLAKAWLYYLQYPDTAITICRKAENISDIQNYINGQSQVYGWLAYLLDHKGQINEAMQYNWKSHSLYQLLGDKKGMAIALNNIGALYDGQGNIQQAIEYYFMALKLREEIDDKQDMANSYNQLGIIYFVQEDFEMALEYYSKSLKLSEEMNDKVGMGLVYQNIATIYVEKGDNTKAFDYFNKSINLRQETGDKRGLAMSHKNIGDLLKEQGEIESAKINYQKSIEYSKSIDNIKWMASSYEALGILYFEESQVKLAEQNGIISFNLANKIQSPILINTTALLLSKIEKSKKNYQQSLKYYELHIQMRDSIKNEANQKVAIRQQTKYEFEKEQLIKEQQENEQARLIAEQTERRNNLQYSIILVAILAVFGLVLSLGFINISPKLAEGLIFFAFLIFFEFLLVLTDPYVDGLTGGEPMYKLLTNAVVAGLIFPAHSFFESLLKKRLIDNKIKGN